MSAATVHGPEIARLRAMLGTDQQGTHSVCTVRQDDLRAVLSLVDSMDACCDELRKAISRVTLRRSEAAFDGRQVDTSGMTPVADLVAAARERGIA